MAVEGAGLGLALTSGLVEACTESFAWRVRPAGFDVHGAPRAGALADLSAPAARGPYAPSPRGSRHAVVLYIEETARISNSCAIVVDAFGGLELHVAEHPLKGLEDAERLRPDVICWTSNLPDIDGFEVKARLDVNPPLPDSGDRPVGQRPGRHAFARADAGFHSYLPSR